VLCAKASILLQYFRVFPTKRMRLICWVMIALLASYGTWCIISAFLNCYPVAKFWNHSLPGSCLDSKGLWFSNAAMHISTDLAILLIPVPALAVLDLPRKQKFALIAIFALGGFVCVTSICRLVALKKIADSSDPTCKLHTYIPHHIAPPKSKQKLTPPQTTTSAQPPGPPSNATSA
jgi:hypothetical protein